MDDAEILLVKLDNWNYSLDHHYQECQDEIEHSLPWEPHALVDSVRCLSANKQLIVKKTLEPIASAKVVKQIAWSLPVLTTRFSLN